MLTEAQVAKARTLPGCNDLTAENAVDKLFSAAETLQKDVDGFLAKAEDATKLTAKITALEGELATAKSAIPKQVDSSILSLVAMAAETEMQACVDAQSLTPATAAELKSVLIGDPDKGQYNAAALTGAGKPLAVSVFGALRRNGPMPQVGKQPNAQPAPKAIAGKAEDAITPERLQQLLAETPLGQSVLAAAK